jgi:hypothetical protein
MLLRAQWLAATTKGRGCNKRATARHSRKEKVGGSPTNTHSPIFKTKKKILNLNIYVRLNSTMDFVSCLRYISEIYLHNQLICTQCSHSTSSFCLPYYPTLFDHTTVSV